jgi:hypothetical protein
MVLRARTLTRVTIASMMAWGVVGGAASGAIAPLAKPTAPIHTRPIATASRRTSIREVASLHPIGRPGHTIKEQGQASGTYPGSITTAFSFVNGNGGEATTILYMRGGSLTMHSRPLTKHSVVGAIAYAAGTVAVAGGTGIWGHASGILQFKATVDRQNFRGTLEIQGAVNH